jgi:hypothetical protein
VSTKGDGSDIHFQAASLTRPSLSWSFTSLLPLGTRRFYKMLIFTAGQYFPNLCKKRTSEVPMKTKSEVLVKTDTGRLEGQSHLPVFNRASV